VHLVRERGQEEKNQNRQGGTEQWPGSAVNGLEKNYLNKKTLQKGLLEEKREGKNSEKNVSSEKNTKQRKENIKRGGELFFNFSKKKRGKKHRPGYK